MPGPLARWLAAGATAMATTLAATATPAAAGCPALEYQAGLVTAAAALGHAAPDAVAALREVAALRNAEPEAAAVLQPVLDDLGASPASIDDARLRLDSLAAALAYPPGAVCGGGDRAARGSLSQVYASPDLRHLDDTPQAGLLTSLLDALARLVDAAAGSLGPTGLAVLALAVVGVALLLASRRWHGSAPGRAAALDEPAESGDDPVAEWLLGERAAARGDHREAVRRDFRAALLEVALRGRLHLDAAWTTRELLRRCDAEADVLVALAAAATLFERAWYSGSAVTEADWTRARERCAAVRSLVGRRRVSSR